MTMIGGGQDVGRTTRVEVVHDDDRVAGLERRIADLEAKLTLVMAGLRCAVADGSSARN